MILLDVSCRTGFPCPKYCAFAKATLLFLLPWFPYEGDPCLDSPVKAPGIMDKINLLFVNFVVLLLTHISCEVQQLYTNACATVARCM